MSVTQKYKQQQQQVRVHTSENNYLKGMYFSDVPLVEGYSRVLVNFDIDSLSGKLTPRKGLQSLGVVKPAEQAKPYLHNTTGFNTIVASKICSATDSQDPRKTNRKLQAALYNTDTRGLSILTCAPEADTTEKFKAIPFTLNSDEEYVIPEPFVIDNPGVHGKNCAHNNFFKKPVGTFAFGNQYYTFLKKAYTSTTKIADLPNENYTDNDGNVIQDFVTLRDNSVYGNNGDWSGKAAGKYFKFVSGDSAGTLAYYDNTPSGLAMLLWTRSEEALEAERFPNPTEHYILCYTKLGADIQDDEILLDETLTHADLEPDTYYTCQAIPKQNNPTEASSWGYNMLLDDPYAFVCEDTAVNSVTITGILPYDKSGKVALTPRKNQEITLKAFYRAPSEFHSNSEQKHYYVTTKQKITDYYITEDETRKLWKTYYVLDAGVYREATETDFEVNTGAFKPNVSYYEQYTHDPEVYSDIDQTNLATNHKYGDWWYVRTTEGTHISGYYMVIPVLVGSATTATPSVKYCGATQPAASVQLDPTNSSSDDPVLIRWQMRHSGASDWTDISEEQKTMSELRDASGKFIPFTTTVTPPTNEVIVKLTILDPNDVESDEMYVLSTQTIGISLVTDELANTLNLEAKTFTLGRCTGMCEWEQRLVVWGVPGALNTLFISDINNPMFFPYPNNVDIFTDPIISVHNYGNELLVLTTSALYRLMWDTEGTGWTHKLVQQNLHVTEADTYMSCVIKNMFFFKSGDYYYMMVPKTTNKSNVVGEVAIAPISKPIEKLLDNFHEEVYNLIKVMVDQDSMTDFTDHLVNYFSYVDNTKVVVTYVYDLDESVHNFESITSSEYLYVQLIYDTDTRAWTMRAFEAPHMLFASHADAIQQDRFIDITPAQTLDKLTMQYYKFTNFTDFTIQYLDNEGEPIYLEADLLNYQYLDTGNREINTEMKKRFREFQFKLKNKTNTNLGFYTAFLVDGSLRRDLQRYSPRYILDPTTQEPVVVVERVLDTNSLTYNVTFVTRVERFIIPERMLQDDGELTPTTLATAEDVDQWILNQSAFPGRTLWKVRMPITGKGLTPRAILLSTNQAEYEILGDSWVYRTMNAR